MSTEAVSVEQLPGALKETLSRYVFVLSDAVNEATEEAMGELVAITKRTAPRAGNTYRRYIASTPLPGVVGYSAYLWYVKAPHHRLTHLLEHGHRIKTHGRFVSKSTRASHFVADATKTVYANYEKKLETVVAQVGK